MSAFVTKKTTANITKKHFDFLQQKNSSFLFEKDQNTICFCLNVTRTITQQVSHMGHA
jgi:hypothetical protein